eukprot:scaffold13900_cov141-Skeletonema_dohrnii-CCMP3373.AAC.1
MDATQHGTRRLNETKWEPGCNLILEVRHRFSGASCRIGKFRGRRGDSLGTQDANCECQGVSKNSDVKKYCHLREL